MITYDTKEYQSAIIANAEREAQQEVDDVMGQAQQAVSSAYQRGYQQANPPTDAPSYNLDGH
jgi:F0F1-type ATP synthase membrane subunit b/b'